MSAINSGYLFLAIIGVLSSVVAAFYYIRIIKVIYFEEPKNEFEIILNYKVKGVISLSTIFISFFIIYHSIIIKFSDFGSFHFLVK